MTKMTYVQALDNALTLVTDVETKEKLTALKEQLIKRNSAEHKPTKAQVANEQTKEQVLAYLTELGKGASATEVMVACELPSNQKASALLKQLVDGGKVERVTDGRKTVFKVAQG